MALASGLCSTRGLRRFGKALTLAFVLIGAVLLDPTAPAQAHTGQLIGAEVLDRPGAPTAPEDNPPTITPDPSQAAADKPYGGRCIQLLGAAYPKRCDVGDVTSSTTIDLIGDSHSIQWISGFAAAGEEHGWHVRTYAKESCPFNAQPIELAGKTPTSCVDWNKAVVRAVLGQRPTLVVTTSQPYQVLDDGRVLSSAASVPALTAGYRKVWDRLGAAGIPVAVLDDTPVPNFDMLGCVIRHRHHLTLCARPRADFFGKGSALNRARLADPDVAHLGLNDVVCPWSQCAGVIGGALIWRDNHHLTATYATSAHRQIGTRLATLLQTVHA